jgi:carbon storage regulator CsrA
MSFPEPWVVVEGTHDRGGGQSFLYCVHRRGENVRFALKREKKPTGRFEREIEMMEWLAAGGVKSVLPIIESGQHGKSRYYVMPWMDEGSLDSAVREGRYRDDPAAGLDLLIELGKALAEVHAFGVAHRDLKPGNVLVSQGKPLLVDFGLALDTEESTRLTATAMQIGSRFYMAPENASGQNDAADQRPTDFYAYAKIAWAVLVGHSPPNREEQVEEGWRIEDRTGDPRLAALNPLFANLLKVDPKERLTDWRVVLTELRDIRRRLVSWSAESVAGLIGSLDAGDPDGEHQRLFGQAVDRLAAARPTARLLLTALALSHDKGLPVRHDIWASVAAGIARADSVADVSVAELTQTADELIETAGPYVAVDVVDGQTVCRLAHRVLADYLLAASPPDQVARWGRGIVQALFQAVRAMVADPYLACHLSPYLVNHLAGHVGEADAWDALAEAPDVLDHVSPGAVTEQVLATSSDRVDWPAPVAATAMMQSDLERASPIDRPLMRAVEMARQPGSDHSALIATQAHSTGAWRLAWARTRGRPAHLEFSGRGFGAAVVAAVRMGKRWVLAVGDADGTVQLWNPITGRRVGNALAVHTKGVTALAPIVLPGGRTLLASGGADNTVWLWDLATDRVFGAGPLAEKIGLIRALAAVPVRDGRTLLAQVSQRYNRVHLWDPMTRRQEREIGRDVPISTIAVVPRSDGSALLATGGSDCIVRLWDPATGEMMGEPLTGHTHRIHSLTVLTAEAQGGRDGLAAGHSVLLASSGWDGAVRVWDLDTRECVACYPLGGINGIRARAITAVRGNDGRELLAAAYDGSDDKAVHLFGLRSGEPWSHPFAGHQEPVVSMASLPVRGRMLVATADSGGSVFVWDPLLQRPDQAADGDEASVSCLAVLPRPDQTPLLVTAGTGDTLSLWDPSTGEPVGERLNVHPKRLTALTAVRGADGRTVLAGARGDSVRLWDPSKDLSRSTELAGHTGTVTALAPVPTPGGAVLLASGGDDSTVRLWNPVTGQLIRQPYTRHLRRVRALAALSLLGGQAVVASAGDDQVVRLWETVTGQPLRDLTGHDRPVTALAVASTRDGEVLASGSDNGTVLLWRIHGDSADELPLVRHGSPIAGIGTLSAADGSVMFTVVGSDGTLRLVNPSSGHAGPAVSLGITVETIAAVGSRLVVGSRHGMFAVDLQPDRFPVQLQLSPQPGPVGPDDVHGDVDELATYHDEIPRAWLAPPSGTRWSAVLAGVTPLADEHLETKLGIRDLEPDRAADVRQWLHVALASQPVEVHRSQAAIRRHLRYLGAASVALGVHTLLAMRPHPLSPSECARRARLLIHPMSAAIAEELLPHGRVTAAEDGSGGADATTEALLLLGVLSLNQMDQARSDLLQHAFDAASREVEADMDHDAVAQLVAGLGTPFADGDEPRPARRTALPRSVIVSADQIARLFGLAEGNVHFQQALTDPSWCPDGQVAAPEMYTNAALAALGAFVANDLYATAVVQAMLSSPDIPAAELRHGVGTAALAALSESLGLSGGLLFGSPDPLGGPDTSMTANAARAVLAAAYLSYSGNKRRFSDHLPDSVQSWLQLGVLSVHPTSPVAPAQREPRRRDSRQREPRQATPAPAPAPTPRAAPKSAARQGRPPQPVYRSNRTNEPGGLVLSRRPGERILLGDDVAVEVVQIVANKVRLKIKAPESLPIMRDEIYGIPAPSDETRAEAARKTQKWRAAQRRHKDR